MAGQFVNRLLRELRQFEMGGNGHVGRQDPRTAGIRHDGHPSPAGDLPLRLAEGAFMLVGKGIGKIEEFGDGLGPDDPRLLENGVVDGLRTGQGAGVGRGRLGAGPGPARFDDQYRGGPVAGGDLLDRLDELPSLAEFLQVEDDDRRVEVVVEVAEQIQLIHVRFVADGDELRETEISVRRKIEDGGAERPALGNERNVARRRASSWKSSHSS